MGGNSGILSNVCLPTIVGIFWCPFDSGFLHMPVSSSAKTDLPQLSGSVFEAHPKVFRGKQPQVPPSIPSGWRGLVDEFCLLLEAVCDEDELSSLQFHRILEESGRLILDFTFGCELSARQARIIDARVFALSNRSVFTCFVCGRLAETLTRPPVRCTEHSTLA